MSGIEAAGSWDPSALLLAGPVRVKHLFVEGRHVVDEGQITTLDLPAVVERSQQLTAELVG